MTQTKEEKTTSGWIKEAHKGYIRVAVLIIINKKASHGYEIMKEIKEKTSGFWTPTAGGVYPILSDLEKSGYIKGEWETNKNRKLKTYKITESGKLILERAIVKQNEIATNMNSLFKEFSRDVLNIAENVHPTMPSPFSAFLEEEKQKEPGTKELKKQREQIGQSIKKMQERLKTIDQKIKENKTRKSTSLKNQRKLTTPD